MSPVKKTVSSPLPGVTALTDRAGRTITIKVKPGHSEAGELKTFLYRALNAYEKSFTVIIEGLPYCFLPEAADHMPPVSRGKGRRFPACKACRMSGLCPGLPAGRYFSGVNEKELEPVLPLPSEIVMEINRSCNLACAVCSSHGLKEKLSPAFVRAQLEAARDLGIKNVRFTGGEPYLHPGLSTMLEAAKALGFYTLLNTNATVPSAPLIKKTAPLVDNVLISLQGFDAASDAAATGVPGLFEKRLANARLFRSCGVPVLRLGTVISGTLLANFEKYLALAKSTGADAWELYRPMAAGRGDPAVTPAALRALAGRLESGIGARMPVYFANPLPLCLFKKSQAPLFLGARFDDGHTRLVLDPRGFYKPSYYAQDDLGADIKGAWNSPVLSEFSGSKTLPLKCRRCVLMARCLGGSRSLARTAGKAADPWLPRSLRPRRAE